MELQCIAHTDGSTASKKRSNSGDFGNFGYDAAVMAQDFVRRYKDLLIFGIEHEAVQKLKARGELVTSLSLPTPNINRSNKKVDAAIAKPRPTPMKRYNNPEALKRHRQQITRVFKEELDIELALWTDFKAKYEEALAELESDPVVMACRAQGKRATEEDAFQRKWGFAGQHIDGLVARLAKYFAFLDGKTDELEDEVEPRFAPWMLKC